MAGMLAAVMAGLTMPFVAVIARKTLNASAFEIAVLTMAPLAGNLLSLLRANVMEGRPKMPFAMWSWITGRAFLLLCVFAATSRSLVAIMAAMYLIDSVARPTYPALMKEIYPDGDRARIMGYVRVCLLAVFVLVTALAAPLLHGDNYRYVFPVAGLFGIAAAVVFGRIPTSETAGDPSVRLRQFIHNGVLILRDDPGFRWFCAGTFVFGFSNLMVQPIYIIRQVQIGVGTNWAGIYSIAMSLIMTVGYFYWGGFIDKRNPQVVVALQALCMIAVPLNYYVATQPWMLLPGFLMLGIIWAGVELVYLNGILRFVPRERITHYQAVFLTLMGLRGVVAPFVGAAMYQSGVLSVKAIFLVTTAMLVFSVVILLLGIRKSPTTNLTAD